MKKTFLFTAFSLLFTLQTASAQEACIQVIQPAVDSNGVCKEFATPCDVPDDWKKLPAASCEDVKSDDNTNSVQRVAERRQRVWENALREKALEKEPEIEESKWKKRSDRPRIGSGSLTKIEHTPASYEQNQKESDKKVRTFNDKSYDRSYLEKRNYYRTNKGGYQTNKSSTKEERQSRRQARPAFESRTDAVRTGELDNAPKLSERLKQRFSESLGERYRKASDRRFEKKENTERTLGDIQLRRTYRGSIQDRKNANVEGDIETEEEDNETIDETEDIDETLDDSTEEETEESNE